MALKTIVIVSGINNLSDSRYCAGMGVNYLGFNIDEHSNKYVSPEMLNELKGWVSGVEIVTESVSKNSNDGYEANYHHIYDLDLLEKSNEPVFLSLSVDQAIASFDALLSNASLIKHLILTNTNQSLSEIEISLIEKLSSNISVLLGFGVEANNVTHLIETTAISGIALEGGDEIRPGFKDYDELADILEALEID